MTFEHRVLIADGIDPRAEAWLRGHCEIARPPGPGAAGLIRALAGCDGMIVRTTRVGADVLGAGDRLRVVAKHGSGIDNIDIDAASARGVLVASCPGDNAPAVAEFALACVLLMLRPIVAGAAWLAEPPKDGSLIVAGQAAGLVGHELSSQTVGVVGWGEIGARVGRAVKALGGNVIAYDPFRQSSEIRADDVEAAAELAGLLARADIVTLHVPLMRATRNLIGASELAIMRAGACLINTSRGGVVDETALAESVQRGHLRAAAVDVFAHEPPPPDHPLLAIGAVLCTPHMAGSTSEALLRMGMSAARAVVDVLSGRRPQHLVNPAVVTAAAGNERLT